MPGPWCLMWYFGPCTMIYFLLTSLTRVQNVPELKCKKGCQVTKKYHDKRVTLIPKKFTVLKLLRMEFRMFIIQWVKESLTAFFQFFFQF